MFVYLDPPDELSITGYQEGEVLTEGTRRNLKCIAVSGNPLPSLEWFAGGIKLDSAKVDKGEADSYVSSEILVTVDRADNAKKYECKGKNEANPDAPVTRSLRMSVEFPPRVLNITVSPPKPVEGESAVLTCVTDTSNPGVSIRWRHNGDILEATDSKSKPGPHGGLVTTNVLQIDVTTEHVGAEFTCEASHDNFTTTIRNTTVLTIKCKLFSFTFHII